MASPKPSNSSDKSLIQAVLEPLLDDFQYWFSETEALLTSPKANCLEQTRRETLLEDIKAAQQEVATMKTLLLATEGKAGVDTSVVGDWHQLVSRCWQVARDVRQMNQ